MKLHLLDCFAAQSTDRARHKVMAHEHPEQTTGAAMQTR